MSSSVAKMMNQRRKKLEILDREFYLLRSILGNDWALFFFFLGGREAGK